MTRVVLNHALLQTSILGLANNAPFLAAMDEPLFIDKVLGASSLLGWQDCASCSKMSSPEAAFHSGASSVQAQQLGTGSTRPVFVETKLGVPALRHMMVTRPRPSEGR